MARVIRELVYEYWDCTACGQKAIRGDRTTCAGCGKERDKNVVFYRQERREEKVTDAAQGRKFRQGPDWACGFCDNMNSAGDGSCRSCGADREKASKTYFQLKGARRQAGSGQVDASGKTQRDRKGVQPTPRRLGPWLAGGASLVLMIAGAIWLYQWATTVHEIQYRVQTATWTTTIETQRYRIEEQSDWKGELKGEDRVVVSEAREIRSYRQVPDGFTTETYYEDESYQSGTQEECTTKYESTGSGAAEKVTTCVDVPVYATRKVERTRQVQKYRDEPVYDTKVYYRAGFFRHHRSFSESGSHGDPERWPEIELGTGERGRPDRKGASDRTNQVSMRRITDTDDEDIPANLQLETTDDLFVSRYKPGATVTMKFENLGGLQLLPGEIARTAPASAVAH